MSANLPEPLPLPHIDHLVTEDDAPVDNIFSEKQQRLLVEPLYTSWRRPDAGAFLAMANVGLYYSVKKPPIVPDAMLSLDVEAPDDLWLKSNRSYFYWEYGKSPEVAVEIVSNLVGEELGDKLRLYAKINVLHYVVWDPENTLGRGRLQVFVLDGKRYKRHEGHWLDEVGLGLTIWNGHFEGKETEWLRWCDQNENVIPTGAERAERLAAKLRALGVDPDA